MSLGKLTAEVPEPGAVGGHTFLMQTTNQLAALLVASVALAACGHSQRSPRLRVNARDVRVSFDERIPPEICREAGVFAGELVAPVAEFVIETFLSDREGPWLLDVVGSSLGNAGDVTLGQLSTARSMYIHPRSERGEIVVWVNHRVVLSCCYQVAVTPREISVVLSEAVPVIY